MTAHLITDRSIPLHVSEEDSLMQDETTDVEITTEDVAIIATIRNYEAAGHVAQAAWWRAAYRALRATRHASSQIRAALNNGNTEHRGNGSNGSNGTDQPK